MRLFRGASLAERKRAALEKVVLRLTDPDVWPARRVSMEECSALLSRPGARPVTPAMVGKLEKKALDDLRNNLSWLGVDSLDEILPACR